MFLLVGIKTKLIFMASRLESLIKDFQNMEFAWDRKSM